MDCHGFLVIHLKPHVALGQAGQATEGSGTVPCVYTLIQAVNTHSPPLPFQVAFGVLGMHVTEKKLLPLGTHSWWGLDGKHNTNMFTT